MAVRWPYSGRTVAEQWPNSGRTVAEQWPMEIYEVFIHLQKINLNKLKLLNCYIENLVNFHWPLFGHCSATVWPLFGHCSATVQALRKFLQRNMKTHPLIVTPNTAPAAASRTDSTISGNDNHHQQQQQQQQQHTNIHDRNCDNNASNARRRQSL